MSQSNNRWGVELQGHKADQEAWRKLLRPPFDPYVEEIQGRAEGSYFALRSAKFDDCETADEVRAAAKGLIRTLNVAMQALAHADAIKDRAIIEFLPDGSQRKAYYLEAEAGTIRTRTALTLLGEDETTDPRRSRAQEWVRAAAVAPEIESVCGYLEGSPGWLELYKAYEAIRAIPGVNVKGSEARRFAQTANTGNRHHSGKGAIPHKNPMTLGEARALVEKWVSTAVDEILHRKPPLSRG